MVRKRTPPPQCVTTKKGHQTIFGAIKRTPSGVSILDSPLFFCSSCGDMSPSSFFVGAPPKKKPALKSFGSLLRVLLNSPTPMHTMHKSTNTNTCMTNTLHCLYCCALLNVSVHFDHPSVCLSASRKKTLL